MLRSLECYVSGVHVCSGVQRRYETAETTWWSAAEAAESGDCDVTVVTEYGRQIVRTWSAMEDMFHGKQDLGEFLRLRHVSQVPGR